MRGRVNLLAVFFLLLVSSLLCGTTQLSAQEKREAKDSLIRLIEAGSAQLQEIDGVSYRKIVGPAARFLHNNTYLICDTALWNVNTNVIKALGNVQIIQENTFLTSDKIDYIIEQDLAQFRGSLVELFDKEGNVLRTNYLDYNTKDSIATFYAGGAMRNTDGNLIESRNGEYRAADKTFSFRNNVQMFTDSVFIKSDKVDYNTVENKAYFGLGTTAWQQDNMLFANDGEFDRENNLFNFRRDSYILTKEQELWADTLSYHRNTGVANLYSNIQILDTVQSSYCFADEAVYNPEPMKITLSRRPSVAMYGVENGVRDTIFMAADTINYYSIRYCDIDSTEIARAAERKKLSDIDPLAKIEQEGAVRRRENENAANSPFINGPVDKEKLKAQGGAGAGKPAPKGAIPPSDPALQSVAASDSLKAATAVKDSLSSIGAVADSLEMAAAAVGPDTTSVAFIDAWHNVKVFKNDIQALCDSMKYTGIDSIARLYVNPVIWNNVKHQFTADSIQIVLKDNVLNKANLISNAFIASQEDSVHFNQIKGAEMVAYFKDNDLYRYDALGGASMIFYLEEDSLITMMNQKEGKIISARLKNREIQRIKYFENLSNNLLPTFGLPLDEQRLKGYNWRGEERPLSRFEVADRKIRASLRENMVGTPFPDYPFAKVYFASTRDSILQYKAYTDSLRAAKEFERIRAKQIEKEKNQRDSLLRTDSLAKKDLPNPADSSDIVASGADSLAAAQDSLKNTAGILLKEKAVADQKALVDSLQQHLLSDENWSDMPKDERRRLKKEQALLRKQIKKQSKLLLRLEKALAREKKRSRG